MSNRTLRLQRADEETIDAGATSKRYWLRYNLFSGRTVGSMTWNTESRTRTPQIAYENQ